MQMWRLKVQVRGDGTAEVTGMSPDVPPCEVEVRGHDDGNRVTLIARQRDPQGRFVAAAYHRRDRAEETGDASFACPPEDSPGERYGRLREAGQRFSRLLGQCPDSDEKARAAAALREAVMWGDAAVSKGK